MSSAFRSIDEQVRAFDGAEGVTIYVQAIT